MGINKINKENYYATIEIHYLKKYPLESLKALKKLSFLKALVSLFIGTKDLEVLVLLFVKHFKLSDNRLIVIRVRIHAIEQHPHDLLTLGATRSFKMLQSFNNIFAAASSHELEIPSFCGFFIS